MEHETSQSSDAPETGDGPPAESPEAQLQGAREDAAKYLDNWRRAEADFQNYKRRAEQEKDELRRFGHVSVIINLLPIVDDFERAFSSLDTTLSGLTWLDGMRLIYRKLLTLLDASGVSPIETEGQQFDPRYHEAVAHVEGPEGKVISEVQRGYKLGGRVLRPAMVVVGSGTGKEQGTGNLEQGSDENAPT